MKILVAYAGRMGSTAEIAERIGEQLRLAGHHVEVSSCPEVSAVDVDAYEAVILGSALYMGHWEKAALGCLRDQTVRRIRRPTWLFQSGPCGEGFDLAHIDTPRAVRKLSSTLGLTPPVTFGGRLDRARATTLISRWVATGAYAGDFRDWEQVRSWTTDIVEQLAKGHPDVSPSAPARGR